MNTLILVTGGSFMMGNPLSDNDILRIRVIHQPAFRALLRERADIPHHNRTPTLPTVLVDSFWISQYPITQGEWSQMMPDNPSHFCDPNRPVECVTWHSAIAYCNQRSYHEGRTPCYQHRGDQLHCNFHANGYRLPTEAEWAYAARGGQVSEQFVFPGSNDVNEVAWHRFNSKKQTHRVGQKQPNELGLYDMAGNVYELCWDWHEPHDAPPMNAVNPTGPAKPTATQKRVARGGCYLNAPHLLYTGRRLGRAMDEWNDHLGFRVVRRD